MPIDAKNFPALKEAWDAYGHSVSWNQLYGVKIDRGCYAVVCWKNPDGTLGLADLARGGEDMAWEMQNDGFAEDISMRDWNKLYIVPDCDWFAIPGHPIYDRD